MNYIKTKVPEQFELYNIEDDIRQKFDTASKYPDVFAQMKSKMLKLRQEMIDEGGDWYAGAK